MTQGSGTSETVIPQDVVLCDAGRNPAGVAEAVRAMTGLEPATVQALIARVPSVLRSRIAPALAEALRSKLVALGAGVVLRDHGVAPEADESFDVYLRDQGLSKINVVRALKNLLGLTLGEAVELVGDAPTLLKRKVGRDEAEELRHELVEAGATVDVRVHDGTAPEPVVRASPPPPPPSPTPADQGSGGYAVILQDHGPNKISVIKVIREVTGLGLKDAKDLSEAPGSTVKQGLGESEAREIERQLVAVGGKVRVTGQGASAPARTPTSSGAAADDGTRHYAVILDSHGPNKISVIKVIREVTGLGLKEAKDLSETPGSTVKQDLSESEARAIERQLVAVGGSVTLTSRRGSASPGTPTSSGIVAVDLVLENCGPRKIAVIKLIRELTGLGLKEAKDLAETPGSTIKEGFRRSEARALARQFRELEAVVELRGDDDGDDDDDSEEDTVDVFLRSYGPNKISVIKEVRGATGFGLKECKDLVEAAPSLIKAGMEREAALQLQRALVEAGAVVELR